MSIYKPITVTGEWSILTKMNGMSFPAESRLIVQPDHMALAVGFQKKSRMQLIRRQECRAVETIAVHHFTCIPIPPKTLQISVKREVRDRWNRLKLLYIYYPRLTAKSHCESHACFINKNT